MTHRDWIIAFVLLVAPLVAAEAWVRTSLFDYASYTNSRHLDRQLANFAVRRDWTVVALGSSEVRYGFDPETFDRGLHAAGIDAALTFNLGVDGFNVGHYRLLLPALDLGARAPRLRVALIGVNMFQEVDVFPTSAASGFDCKRMSGELQRSVYSSSFGKDTGLDALCAPGDWTRPVIEAAECASALLRYRQAVRGVLLGGENVLGGDEVRLQTARGLYDREGMSEESRRFDVDRWLKLRAQNPRHFTPMDEAHWPGLLKPGGFFDGWADAVRARGMLPVFFALPTNPVMAIERNRVGTWTRNAALMSDWARRTGVVFVDLGLRTGYDRLLDFNDHRHLSGRGARRFSAELAEALAGNPAFRAALAGR